MTGKYFVQDKQIDNNKKQAFHLINNSLVNLIESSKFSPLKFQTVLSLIYNLRVLSDSDSALLHDLKTENKNSLYHQIMYFNTENSLAELYHIGDLSLRFVDDCLYNGNHLRKKGDGRIGSMLCDLSEHWPGLKELVDKLFLFGDRVRIRPISEMLSRYPVEMSGEEYKPYVRKANSMAGKTIVEYIKGDILDKEKISDDDIRKDLLAHKVESFNREVHMVSAGIVMDLELVVKRQNFHAYDLYRKALTKTIDMTRRILSETTKIEEDRK
jgi:hypothetical protein